MNTQVKCISADQYSNSMSPIQLQKTTINFSDNKLDVLSLVILTDHKLEISIYNEENNKGVLRLAFHDSDPNNKHNPHIATEEQLFGEKRANLIIDFVAEIKDKVDMLVVHCEAGVSRSPAIAAVLAKIHFGDDKAFFKAPFTPNMHVYRVMLDTAHARLGVL